MDPADSRNFLRLFITPSKTTKSTGERSWIAIGNSFLFVLYQSITVPQTKRRQASWYSNIRRNLFDLVFDLIIPK